MKNKQTDEIAKEPNTIPYKGSRCDACNRPTVIEQRVNAPNCKRNMTPNAATGMPNWVENQVTSAGRVFTEMANPARLITKPVRRTVFSM